MQIHKKQSKTNDHQCTSMQINQNQ
jgi:hypothetical protein